jgi:hypothetical protein
LFAAALGKVMTSNRIDLLIYHYGNKKSLSRDDFIRSQEAYENSTYGRTKFHNTKHMLTFAVYNKSQTGQLSYNELSDFFFDTVNME